MIAVLCDGSGQRPVGPGIDRLAGRAVLRFTDAAGLAEALRGARALLVWDFFSGALRPAWPQADRLEWVHVAAAGVDTLLFQELVASPVLVTNARGVFDRPIAEYVLACVLAVAKDLPGSARRQAERRWEHRETTSVAGARALVVGTGGIGRQTARLLAAVGVQVRGAGRRPVADDPDFGVVLDSARLAEHVGWADHLVLAAPLTPQTRGMVDAAVLAAMRPGSHLVNVGRGALVIEADLVRALNTGRPAAASLDVFSTEPLPPDSPLWTAPGVLVSAHMSGDVVGWRQALADQFAGHALGWLDGIPPGPPVDKERGYVSGRTPAEQR